MAYIVLGPPPPPDPAQNPVFAQMTGGPRPFGLHVDEEVDDAAAMLANNVGGFVAFTRTVRVRAKEGEPETAERTFYVNAGQVLWVEE
jgi:hypothetical protein